ncbi:MAG: UDP-N-acetylmuramate dehydrogenase [Spirochaetales bacterium]|nr:UDP-N-acetylmuramate dehydrogenase [Spirochaetales bacterium]
MDNLRNILKRININGELHFNEPMSDHTTFQTGGPAEIFIKPADTTELKSIIEQIGAFGLDFPIFILGGGANLLVSDEGISGLVIDMTNLNAIKVDSDGTLICGAGTRVDEAAEAAYSAGLSGFDSFYGMPGTIGGGIWMNARCYGTSFSDILKTVTYIDEKKIVLTMENSDGIFNYKQSPFQNIKSVIIEASFHLNPGNPAIIRKNMNSNRSDREKKGHYAAPCAGSIFKNNRSFGEPSGAIIDSLGLRGKTIGGAKISDKHANIIINTGSATSKDILRLINFTREEVKQAYGFELEPEIQLIGNFS